MIVQTEIAKFKQRDFFIAKYLKTMTTVKLKILFYILLLEKFQSNIMEFPYTSNIYSNIFFYPRNEIWQCSKSHIEYLAWFIMHTLGSWWNKNLLQSLDRIKVRNEKPNTIIIIKFFLSQSNQSLSNHKSKFKYI